MAPVAEMLAQLNEPNGRLRKNWLSRLIDRWFLFRQSVPIGAGALQQRAGLITSIRSTGRKRVSSLRADEAEMYTFLYPLDARHLIHRN